MLFRSLISTELRSFLITRLACFRETLVKLKCRAASSVRPENYIGLHFFAPVEEVPLVEIVKGKKTSDETIARAFDFVKKMRKTPIIVKDSWGFFASRVQNTYILEGLTMLEEG